VEPVLLLSILNPLSSLEASVQVRPMVELEVPVAARFVGVAGGVGGVIV